MLVFVDESGDAGRKTGSGSSEFFIVSCVLFPDRKEAGSCDRTIAELKESLGFSQQREFHFNRETPRIREQFLSAVDTHDWLYSFFVLNKERLTGEGFKYPKSLYKYAVKRAFENISEILEDASVVFDQCGDRHFVKTLRTYLRRNSEAWVKGSRRKIKNVRSSKSHTDNLLQMADMVCGSASRHCRLDRTQDSRYRDAIRKGHEIHRDTWQKLSKQQVKNRSAQQKTRRPSR